MSVVCKLVIRRQRHACLIHDVTACRRDVNMSYQTSAYLEAMPYFNALPASENFWRLLITS